MGWTQPRYMSIHLRGQNQLTRGESEREREREREKERERESEREGVGSKKFS